MKHCTGYLALVFAILLTGFGCSFESKEIQAIEISNLPDVESNTKLAADLMQYDPRYLAHKISSLNELTAPGVEVGYFIPSSGGNPSYRITYNKGNPDVVENIENLKSEFDEFIPVLAAFHVSKLSLFDELNPVGSDWLDSLMAHPIAEVREDSSNLLKAAATEAQLANAVTRLKDHYGDRKSSEFVRGQYYEAFGGIPESVSLFYQRTYTNSESIVRVSLHREDEEWKVMGFLFQ